MACIVSDACHQVGVTGPCSRSFSFVGLFYFWKTLNICICHDEPQLLNTCSNYRKGCNQGENTTTTCMIVTITYHVLGNHKPLLSWTGLYSPTQLFWGMDLVLLMLGARPNTTAGYIHHHRTPHAWINKYAHCLSRRAHTSVLKTNLAPTIPAHSSLHLRQNVTCSCDKSPPLSGPPTPFFLLPGFIKKSLVGCLVLWLVPFFSSFSSLSCDSCFSYFLLSVTARRGIAVGSPWIVLSL